MNKKLILYEIRILLIIILIGGGIYLFFLKKTKTNETIGTFELADYSYFIDNFSSDQVLGSVESTRLVKENAEVIWIKIYGESIKENKPYKVSFDDKNQVWLVQGTLQKNRVCGVPYILIQKKDGKVLAVWHDK